MNLATVSWRIGRRIPPAVADALARCLSPVIACLPLDGLREWQTSVARATGTKPGWRGRRQVCEAWLRNTMWSMSLAAWSPKRIARLARIAPADVAKLHESLRGPGLILVLPHMGSWDFAGAWCATQNVPVVSVAERLPHGLYELFVAARAGMGMTIYPMGQADLLATLAEDIRARKAVCLLADRDLSRHGIPVTWPKAGTVRVPAGPAVLAARTGADLRVVSTHFDGPHLEMRVSDPVPTGSVEQMMAHVVAGFADAVREHPTSWLMMRNNFR